MNGLLAVARQPLENCPAGRIGKGLEDVISGDRHGQTITNWLLVVKPEREGLVEEISFVAEPRYRGLLSVGALKLWGDCRKLNEAHHSMRKAFTGSMEAARLAGMMPAIAAATPSVTIALDITVRLTLVISKSCDLT